MIATHRLRITAPCPVEETLDIYDVTIDVERLLPVEEILAAVERITAEPLYQEELTARLAEALAARVMTFGLHSGVETTVEAEVRPGVESPHGSSSTPSSPRPPLDG